MQTFDVRTTRLAEAFTGLSLFDPPVVAPSTTASYRRLVKPAVDRLAAFALLVLVAPVMAVVALAVRVSMGPGVLFRQRRVGQGGRVFTVLKFRTMLHEAPAGTTAGPCPEHGHKCPNDPRHTPVGKFLRKVSLDELPQFVNILRGEMSFIGPRPELAEIVERYEPWQHRRHEVKPGLTGLWQVTERGSGVLMCESTQPDIDYVETISLRTDLSILVRTPKALLGSQQGV